MQEKSQGFMNGFTLKLIAVIAMTIDHIGYIFIDPNTSAYLYFRGIGRIAFPIFCFLIVEGFHHTKSPLNYLFRLSVFALLSEVPFDLAFFGTIFDPNHQNVFVTLALGLACLFCLEEMKSRQWFGIFFIILLTISFFIRCDYGIGGVLMICMFYVTKDSIWVRIILFGLICYVFFGVSELPALFSLIFIYLYNGKRGTNKMQWFFYCYYPLHLMILYSINTYLID